MLDVGGGNLYPGLLDYLRGKRLDYFYLDVDPAAVDASRELAHPFGFDGSHFAHGFNDRFDFPAESFDAVFSSHCIEHSIDLRSTFTELNRIIRPGGNLLMAVPLGWETNPEHPYFFGPDHWVALVEDAGFQVRVAQIGREYPEVGVDLFIAARKTGPVRAPARIDPVAYLKDSYRFISHADARVSCSAGATRDEEKTHLRGDRWQVVVQLPAGTEVLPVLHRHDWSGIVQLSTAGQPVQHDLFSWHSYVQPLRHFIGGADALTMTPVGPSACGWSTEAILYGFMVR